MGLGLGLGSKPLTLTLASAARQERGELRGELGRITEDQTVGAVGDELGKRGEADGADGQAAPQHVEHLHGQVEAGGGGVQADLVRVRVRVGVRVRVRARVRVRVRAGVRVRGSGVQADP